MTTTDTSEKTSNSRGYRPAPAYAECGRMIEDDGFVTVVPRLETVRDLPSSTEDLPQP